MPALPAFPGLLCWPGSDRLLGQVLGRLEADPAVDGVALIGSLGRGEEDNWSDIDLLILASDQFIRQFMNEPAGGPSDTPRLRPHRRQVRRPPVTARRRDDPLPGPAA
jgi:hypothetical protein